MKLRYKILSGIVIVLAAGVVALGVAASHTTPCGAAPAPAGKATLMKAIVHRCYGGPDVLAYEDIEKPIPASDELLVRVHAASVNPLDWHYLEGTPYLVRIDSGFGKPHSARLGVDFAGTVEAVGKAVTRFKPGDEVFGAKSGAFAEYVAVREVRAVVPKPASVTFEQAASLPIAAITALQAVRDSGQVQPGQKVLIVGASGGVGTFAVQIAKNLGAEVTGVCSTHNVEMVRALGAEHVIDYTKEDVLQSGQHYDVIVDNVGNRSMAELLAFRKILTPKGRFVLIGGGGPEAGRWIGPMATPVEAAMISPFIDQKVGMMLADLKKDDLVTLGEMVQAGKLTPVIDRRYKLSETAEALRYLEKGHARGKVIINVD